MPGSRKPGPLGLDPFAYDDDFIERLRNSPGFGGFAPALPIGTVNFPASHFYEEAKRAIRAQYVHLIQWGSTFVDDYEGARCILHAVQEAGFYVPGAILQETGYSLGSLLDGLIPGLLQMLAVVGATTLLGGVIGGIVGSLAGGVGAAPGAVIGGELGLDAGMAVLSWLGLAFLAVSIGKGMGELIEVLHQAIMQAWAAQHERGWEEESEVLCAARQLARAAGILVRLILEGIVAYLLKKGAVGSTGAAIGTIKGVQASGASAVSEATVAELVGKLRASGRLRKTGFADWVEKNWRDLVKNPKLGGEAPKASAAGVGGGGGGQSGGAATAGGASRFSPEARQVGATEVSEASGLAAIDIDGLKADQILPGTNGKVAIIGRSMRDVRPFAKGLADHGYDVEIYDQDMIPQSAQREWDDLTAGGRRLSDEEVRATKLYEANQLWAQKLKDDGYTVVDIDNPKGLSASPFYSMEQKTIFGGAK